MRELASTTAAFARSVDADVRNIASGGFHLRRFLAAVSEAWGSVARHRTFALCIQTKAYDGE